MTKKTGMARGPSKEQRRIIASVVKRMTFARKVAPDHRIQIDCTPMRNGMLERQVDTRTRALIDDYLAKRGAS